MKKLDEILLELKALNSQRTQGEWMPNDERYEAILVRDIEEGDLWVRDFKGLLNTEKMKKYDSFSETTEEDEKESEGLRTFGYGWGNNFICDMNDGEYHEYRDFKEQKANTDFIVASANYMGLLLDEIDRLRIKNSEK